MVTMMVVMLLTIMTVGVLNVTGNALHIGRVRRLQADAFNAAESGAEIAALWFRRQNSAPPYTSPWNPLGGQQSMGDGITFQVTVYPDSENSTAYLKTYRIVSTGSISATSKQVEIVIRQATFGRFAYFTDRETSSISGGAIWWKAGEICDGPAHSNNSSGSNFQINYNGSTDSIFKDILTGSGPSINYQPSQPQDEATYRRIFEDGSKGFKLGVPRIDLPESSDIQRNAAWGGESGFPGSNGVYLRSDQDGGIYVRGDCTMEWSVPSSSTQRITIKQGWSSTYTVDVNLATGATTLTKPNGSTETGGMVNGVVYCTGNINSLKGEIADNRVSGGEITRRSAWTIATDVVNGKDIEITDDLEYRTQPNKTLPSDASVNLAAGTLGLVAYDVRISSSAPRNLEVDAVMMAGGRNTSGGSFYVENYSSKTPVGTLTVTGGIIQKARGPVGTFNSHTGQMQTGYSKNYAYDPRLATYPPPFYPTTGTYERLSWRALADQ